MATCAPSSVPGAPRCPQVPPGVLRCAPHPQDLNCQEEEDPMNTSRCAPWPRVPPALSQVPPGAPRCTQVPPGVPRCAQVYPGVPRCPQVPQALSQVPPGAPRCAQVCPRCAQVRSGVSPTPQDLNCQEEQDPMNISRCAPWPRVPPGAPSSVPGAPSCAQVCPGAPRCAQVCPGVPRCTQVPPAVPRCTQVCPCPPQDLNCQEEEDPMNKLKGQKIVSCRICKGDHWTTRCPYKDTLGPMQKELAEQLGLSTGEKEKLPGEPEPVAAQVSKTGKYVPPSLRDGASRRGESMQPNRRADDNATIRVTNLSEDTRETDLQELFRPFGSISRIYLAKDKTTGQSKGFAFISFHRREDAARAIAGVSGFGYDHLILNVEWAKPSTN
uniref:Eukaryotic translation initiation factor 3 subunit G n=1 Tax=Taeniopygia guttata TaxID=59729 RepID=A0A674GYW0_TAEGU